MSRWYVAIKPEPGHRPSLYLGWDEQIAKRYKVPQWSPFGGINVFSIRPTPHQTKAAALAWLASIKGEWLDGVKTIFVHRYSRTARIKAALDAAGIPEFDGERCLTLGRRVEMMGERLRDREVGL